ncbi:hypothetical protein ABH922_005353 [Rhodococcus sp. 27YEA15]
MLAATVVIVIVNVNANFSREPVVGDTQVFVSLARIGRTSFVLETSIAQADSIAAVAPFTLTRRERCTVTAFSAADRTPPRSGARECIRELMTMAAGELPKKTAKPPLVPGRARRARPTRIAGSAARR